jgi:hypothetical protein
LGGVSLQVFGAEYLRLVEVRSRPEGARSYAGDSTEGHATGTRGRLVRGCLIGHPTCVSQGAM